MRHPKTNHSVSIEDIVFENRNKAYGAYQLRKNSDKYLKVGIAVAFMFVTILSAYSLTNKRSEITSKLPDLTDTTTIEWKDVVMPELPPLPKQTIEAPTPTAQQMLAEFRPVDDAKPVDDAPHIDDLLPDVPIGLSNINGPAGPTIIDDEPAISGGAGIDNKNDFILFPEIMPEFKGGTTAMMRWLAQEIDYPRLARENGVEGKVFVSFIINTDGSISDVEIMRRIGFGCDEETVRAINAMPNWIPGRQNNVAVRVKRTIPVIFQLD